MNAEVERKEKVEQVRYAQHKTLSGKIILRKVEPWAFIIPHLLFFILFSVIALGANTVISFYNWKLLGAKVFRGWSNYSRVLGDKRFWSVVKNTVMFALISVPIVTALGLAFASLLNSKVYGKLWILICLVSPTFFSSVGILTTWKWIFNSTSGGLMNYSMMKLRILKNAISWIETPTRAWGVILVVTVWWIVGFSILIFLGALRRIPKDQYEAAKIDGAGRVSRFIHITLPWIRNVLVFEMVRQVLLAFGLFDQVYFLTNGGPAGSTRTMTFYLFQTGFQRQDLGRAAAISWFVFIIVLAFGLVQIIGTTKSIKNAEG